ncbi:hypothetical protein DFH11DRAFT_888122 [Phellopilus nigrolimitatus]|nr:hypothetical protein DFH11DRAFT_888122 [Phellopilus nigrolimitatus]
MTISFRAVSADLLLPKTLVDCSLYPQRNYGSMRNRPTYRSELLGSGHQVLLSRKTYRCLASVLLCAFIFSSAIFALICHRHAVNVTDTLLRGDICCKIYHPKLFEFRTITALRFASMISIAVIQHRRLRYHISLNLRAANMPSNRI